MLVKGDKDVKEKLKQRILDLEKLTLNKEAAKMEDYYAEEADKRRIRFNEKLAIKDIKEGSLVLRYDNRFNYNKSDKFLPHWEGPFKVLERFATNGSYQLVDISSKQHRTRVNGWRLKPYFSQVFNEKEDLDKVKGATVSCNFVMGVLICVIQRSKIRKR